MSAGERPGDGLELGGIVIRYQNSHIYAGALRQPARTGRYDRAAAAGETDPRRRAIALYYAVRDGVTYTPYCDFQSPDTYRASAVLARPRPTTPTRSGLGILV